MKRASSLLASAVVPVVVAFVLTARPARLYAESAPPAPSCETLDTKSCDGKLANDPCGDGATGYQCQLTYCRRETEAGATSGFESKLACRYVPPSTSSSSGASSSSGTSGPALGVPVADGDGTAGSGSSAGDDGGCSTSGGDTGGRAWAAALGLFVMVTAIKRRLRRA